MGNGKFDPEKRSKAGKAALLRGVVAVYIGYLGVKIFAAKDTTMSLMTAHILGILFIAAGVAVAGYAVKRWIDDSRADTAPESLPEDTEGVETAEDEQ